MAKWIDIGPSSQFPPGKTCVKQQGADLVVCNLGDKLTALVNECPHAGLPLGDGELRGQVLTCPFHGYAFNVCTGVNIDFPKEERPATVLAIKHEGDRVLVNLEPTPAS